MPSMGAPSPRVNVGVPPAPPEPAWEDLGLPHTGGQRPQGFTALEDHTYAAPTSFAFIAPLQPAAPARVPSPASDGGCHEASAIPAVPVPSPLGLKVAGDLCVPRRAGGRGQLQPQG